MIELNSEARECLTELTRMSESGQSVADFTEKRLYSELSHEEGESGGLAGIRPWVPHDGFYPQMDVYRSLAESGMLEVRRVDGGLYHFGELTTEGRCYLADRAAAEAEAARKLRESRRHDYKVASYGAIAGGIFGLFSGAFAGWLYNVVMGF